MQEAVITTIAHLFSEDVDYINYGHFDFNTLSSALQAKLGFVPLLQERLELDGGSVLPLENILWRP